MKIKSVRCERMWTRAYVDIHTRVRMCLHVCACMRVRMFTRFYEYLFNVELCVPIMN